MKAIILAMLSALPLTSAFAGSVRDFGAIGDGVADDTVALQRAIDAGGVVAIPSGTYLTGTLYLRSGVTLDLADDAKLLATTDPAKWNRRDFCPQNLAYQPDWCSGAHLICAVNVTNVTIRGGEIDGNGRSFFTNTYHLACCGRKQLDEGPFRPRQMLYFCESSNLKFERTRLVNSAFWNLFLHGCENVEIDGLTIRSAEEIGENDGIDIDCCRHVRVRNCDIEVGDDGVTTRGAYTGLSHRRVCEDVEVSDCKVKSFYAHAIRVGVGQGEIKDVAFRRMQLMDTRGAIWVCPKYSDSRYGGCNIHDILFEDIDFRAICWLFVQSDYRFVKKGFFEGEIGPLTFRRVRGHSRMPRSIKTGEKCRLVPPVYEDCEIDEGEALLMEPNELEFFLYRLPGVADLKVSLEDVKARLAQMPAGHPRLFVPSRDALKKLRMSYRQNPERRKLADHIIAKAEALLPLPPVERTMAGKRMCGQEEFQHRMWFLASAYQLTGERKYAERAISEALVMTTWKDWNPSHFLDTAKMLMGMSVVYDWLYNELSDANRRTISAAIIHLGLDAGDGTSSWWKSSPSNWQQVCWCGMVTVALSVYECDPERCAQMIHDAVNKLPLSAAAYAPKGAYPEGPGYWNYGTMRFVLFMDLLQNALGTDFGLSRLPGVLETGLYQWQVLGPTGLTFNYSDNGTKRGFRPALIWLYNRLGRPDLAQAEWRRIDPSKELPYYEYPTLLFFWHDFDAPKAELRPLPLDYVSGGHNPILCSRSEWTPSAAFVAAKGGRCAYFHGHADVGTFVYDLDGVRWIEDLGQQDYLQVEETGMDFWDLSPWSPRWTVYRLSPQAHNLVTIGDYDLNVDGFAPIVDEVSTPEMFSATIDLDATYCRRGATSASRKIKLDRPSRTVTIADRFGGIKPGMPVRWAVITSAKEIKVGGNEILLGDGKGRSARMVVQSPAKVEWRVTDITNGPNEWDEKNPGRHQLSFTLPANADGSYSAVVTLGP